MIHAGGAKGHANEIEAVFPSCMGLPNTGAAGFSADSVPRVVTIAERKHNGIRVLIRRGAARAVTKRGRGGEGGGRRGGR